jgi:hypothetical protein
MVSRREFVRIVPALGVFTTTAGRPQAQALDVPSWPSAPAAEGSYREESFPSQHPFLAKEIVGVSHGNISRVKELVSKHQTLAQASWDWGFGDWETALGAASHVGNRAIAEFLIENGAPPTIFSATMLGQLDVVRAFAAVVPDVNRLRGPHSIPLINHARAGGAQAAEVLKYLESLGNVPKTGDLEPLSATDRASVEGRYVFGDRPRDVFIVDSAQNALGITRAGATRRVLTHLGKLEFYPVGAPAVRIRFERAGTGVALSVFDPDLAVRAIRSA